VIPKKKVWNLPDLNFGFQAILIDIQVFDHKKNLKTEYLPAFKPFSSVYSSKI
jgi:hypothetical protein